ncbi:MAG: glycosyltransferase family 9 protein [Acidobacteria bacterium]|nr:glycosyltransferase family 9 protein [Acidobacteriota bacterium]MDW7984174.1 glycosyltransferase family 9 protein [Acidobacteriota bacterium]
MPSASHVVEPAPEATVHRCAPLKVLVVRMSSFGDIVHTIPAITILRRYFPDAVIDWLVQARYDRLVSIVRGLRRVWTLPGSALSRHASIQKTLRAEQYTWAIDFQGLLKSGVWTWRSRAASRLGFHRSDLGEPIAGVFYNRRPTVHALERARIHVIEKNALILTGMGLDAEAVRQALRDLADPVERVGLLTVSPEATERPRVWLRTQGLRTGSFWVFQSGAAQAAKQWPLEACRQVVLDVYEQTRRPVVILGGPQEVERTQALWEAVRPVDARMAPPLDWKELTVFLRAAAVILGPDTGVLHLADFLGTPVVMGMAHAPAYRNGPFFTRAASQAVEIGTRPARMSGVHVSALRDALVRALLSMPGHGS